MSAPSYGEDLRQHPQGMSVLVDPTICPDCRAVLDATSRCTRCGLHLTGRDAARLWRLMTDADRLVEQLRLASYTSVRTAHPAAAPGPPADRPIAASPSPRPAGRPVRRLPAPSVPVVLLSLGALCLMVAALVFVAIAWSVLGLTGRTLVLLGVTSTVAVVAAVLTRRGLRGAAETLWLIVSAMVTIDLLAARVAGLAGLDALDHRHLALMLGSVLLTLGSAVGLWARRTPPGRLLGVQLVALVGALVATAAFVLLAPSPESGLALGVAALGALAAVLRRRVRVLAAGLAALASVSWLILATYGVDRALEPSTLGAWWSEFRGWPLLVAAAYAGAAAHLVRMPAPLRSVRYAATTASLVLLVLLANAPLTQDHPTRDALLRCATLAALALLVRTSPRSWAWPAAALGSAGAGVLVIRAAVQPFTTVPDTGRPLDARIGTFLDSAASWAYALLAVAVAMLLLSLRRLMDGLPTEVALVAAGVVGVALTVAGGRPPWWVDVTVLVAGALVTGASAWARRHELTRLAVGGGAAAYLSATALVLASPSSLLTALAASVLTVVMAGAAVHAETSATPMAPAVAALATVGAAYALPAWCRVADLSDLSTALIEVGYAAALLLAAAPLTRSPTTRLALESVALVPAVAALGLAGSPSAAAHVLTAGATAVAALVALRRDRVQLSWAVPSVLVPATALRIVETSDPHPELWLLPAAGLLLGAGLLRRSRRAPEAEANLLNGLLLGYAVLGVLAVAPGVPLTAAVATTLLTLVVAVLAATLDRGRTTLVAAVAATLATLAGALATARWCDLVMLGDAEPVVLATYAAVVLVAAGFVARTHSARVALECSAAFVGLVSAFLATEELPRLAVALTVLGAAVAVVAVTQRDRADLGWVGTLVSAAATVVRFEVHAPAPELYTLPTALLLIGAGVLRLREDRECDSLRALGSGLTLALVPSLLLALQDPVTLRGLIVGLGGLVVLGLGVRGRLSAPFLYGAAVVGLLALRELGPLTDAAPRWATLALVGTALLAAGITWEARLRDLRTATRYLTALR